MVEAAALRQRGVPAGKKRGLVVLEVDPGGGGWASLAALGARGTRPGGPETAGTRAPGEAASAPDPRPDAAKTLEAIARRPIGRVPKTGGRI